MSKHVWVENTKPDRPGIWRFKDASNPYEVTEGNLSAWPIGSWCFLMDLPTIVDPPKYRDVRKGDEGKTIQVKVDGTWWDAYFVGFLKNGDVAYEGKDFAMKAKAADARIVDDGQPKREPREWWMNIYPHNNRFAYETKGSADKCADSDRKECVHVREVIDESAS